ncbi:hypothetical protein AJ80_07865 [Polytolypa hystricis UAMH7299]|uniref:Polymerase/histidinol phosphatase N-terminal domain-containing protein n=1 Tax=Polytolypa hystricis (strain UAMH7299) TaxID=1447883 RepID=A0A2B7XH65_POLH7|nr:hypothetical protein AJ80_07865 [Polytolypa hystricis UAMH7299]
MKGPSSFSSMKLISLAARTAAIGAAAAPNNGITSSSHQAPIHLNLSGHIPPAKVLDYIYVDFSVPPRTSTIHVVQNYSHRNAGNSLDLGCFDQQGHHLALADDDFSTGFRGWSGGARDDFTISRRFATPGYLAGEIEPGIWSVALGPYKSVPEGIDYELNIELSFEHPSLSEFEVYSSLPRSGAEIAVRDQTQGGDYPVGDGAKTWFRGDLHMHTIYSDGKHTPNELITFAQAANLSFIFTSEHNTPSIDHAWDSVAPGSLLVSRGIEVTTRSGHWNAIGLTPHDWVEFRYRHTDNPGLAQAVQHVRKRGGLAVINHPFDSVDCLACDWSYGFEDSNMDAIEVWNADWDPSDEKALVKWHELLSAGSHIAAIGGSDFHTSETGKIGSPTTLVHASRLETAEILAGIRRSRAYVVHDSSVDIHFSVIDKLTGKETQIGDRVKLNRMNDRTRGPLFAILRASRGVPEGSRVVVMTDRGILHEERVSDDSRRKGIKVRLDERSTFVRVEVRRADGRMLALTNPIWIG